LNSKLVGELREIAKKLNVPKFETLKKQELVYQILDLQASSGAKNAPKEEVEKPKRGRKPKADGTEEEIIEEPKVDSRFVSVEPNPVEVKTPEPKNIPQTNIPPQNIPQT